MSVGSYLKQNWFVLLLTVGFGVWGVYASLLSHETRDPMFVVDPDRVEILSAARIANAPIKVTRRDNTPIRSDIYAVRFYLWNAGKRSIRPENVLETIRVALDSESEILDFKVLKVSRPITHARLVATPPGPGPHLLVVVFGILERQDGLTGQIIYQGRRDAALSVSGIIEGVAPGIASPRAPSGWSIFSRHWPKTLREAGGVSVLLLVILVIRRKKQRQPMVWGPAIRFATILALTYVILSLIMAYTNQLDTPPATVVTMVPSQLLP